MPLDKRTRHSSVVGAAKIAAVFCGSSWYGDQGGARANCVSDGFNEISTDDAQYLAVSKDDQPSSHIAPAARCCNWSLELYPIRQGMDVKWEEPCRDDSSLTSRWELL